MTSDFLKVRFIVGLCSCLLFAEQRVKARSWQDSIARTVPATDTESAMPYRFFLPANYDPNIEYPLVLFLHGAGERGTDNTIQVQRNIGNLIEQTDANFPAILVAPQLPPGQTRWGVDRPEDRTDEILQTLLGEYTVDRDRLYVTGLSLGGFGTMSYLHHYNVRNPDQLQFAAGAPTAAAFPPVQTVQELAILQQTPIWLSHGTRDTVVDPFQSRVTYNLLAAQHPFNRIEFDGGGPSAGGLVDSRANARYTEYPTVGHNSWTPWYGSAELYDWLFSQSLPSTPVTVPFENSLILETPIVDGLELLVANNSDLLQTAGVLLEPPSFENPFATTDNDIQNLYDGEVETTTDSSSLVTSFAAGDGNFIEFMFDTSEHAAGYDIQSITTFAAGTTRTGQAYEVLVRLVDEPGFHSLVDFSEGLTGPFRDNVVTQVTHQDELGQLLASGVDAIRFEFSNSDGSWNLYREIDIVGQPTAVPEFATLALLAVGLLVEMARPYRFSRLLADPRTNVR